MKNPRHKSARVVNEGMRSRQFEAAVSMAAEKRDARIQKTRGQIDVPIPVKIRGHQREQPSFSSRRQVKALFWSERAVAVAKANRNPALFNAYGAKIRGDHVAVAIVVYVDE